MPTGGRAAWRADVCWHARCFTRPHPPSTTPTPYRVPQVTLHLSKEVPLMVEYKLESLGYLRYFLAPKIDEDAA